MIYQGRGLWGEGDSDGGKGGGGGGGGARMEGEVRIKEGCEGMRRRRTRSKTCYGNTGLLLPAFPWMLI